MTALISETLISGRDSSGDNLNRDVEQVVYNIDRQDTPFQSMIGDKKVTHTTHEWLVDDYEDAEFVAYKENYQFAASDISTEVREVKSNNAQIFLAPYGVSDTTIAVDTIGVANEFNYQGIKKGVRLKRNIERQLLNNPATGDVQGATKSNSEASSGDLTTASDGGRRLGSVFTFAGIHSMPADGSNVTKEELADDNNDGTNNTVDATFGDDSEARQDGTSLVRVSGSAADRNLTRTIIRDHMALAYEAGARPQTAMMSPTMKANWSATLMEDGTTNGLIQRINAKESGINMAIDMVNTDFGALKLVPNWLYNDKSGTGATDPNTILVFDSSKCKTGTLRKMTTKPDLGMGGDGMRGIIRCEKTLVVETPKSVGVIHAINETNT